MQQLVWYNHTNTHTDKMLFRIICLRWGSRMRLLTCASCRQDWALWNLALPWLWHAEAAGIWAAQAAGRERRWVIQRDGQQMQERQHVWVKHRPTEQRLSWSDEHLLGGVRGEASWSNKKTKAVWANKMPERGVEKTNRTLPPVV